MDHAVFLAGYSDFLHHLELANHDLVQAFSKICLFQGVVNNISMQIMCCFRHEWVHIESPGSHLCGSHRKGISLCTAPPFPAWGVSAWRLTPVVWQAGGFLSGYILLSWFNCWHSRLIMTDARGHVFLLCMHTAENTTLTLTPPKKLAQPLKCHDWEQGSFKPLSH